jgi:hypothetical protein
MPVLGTKLRVPAPRRRLVPRERLVGQLQADPTTMPPLVLISALAGFGKITLLTQWLTPGRAEDPAPARTPQALRVAWLSLDAADADLRAFLTTLWLRYRPPARTWELRRWRCGTVALIDRTAGRRPTCFEIGTQRHWASSANATWIRSWTGRSTVIS